MPEASSKKSREPSPGVANAGARALALAVAAGDAAEVGRLVAAGAAADVPRAGGETLLMSAAAKGHADVARVLLDGGADANARRSDGFTPLLVAAFRGHAEVVGVLLERGADASARTRLGASAGEWAASHGFAETAALLKNAARARERDGAAIKSNGAVARVAAVRASAVDERSAGGNVEGVEDDAAMAGVVEKSRREVVASPPRESLTSPQTLASTQDEPTVSQPRELFAASAGAQGSGGAGRYRAALPVALVLVAVACVALYAFVWRVKSPPSSQPPTAPAGGASNVVPQPVPQTEQPATNAQPVPSVSPVDATGAPNNMPVIITVPAEVAPVGVNGAAGPPVAPGGPAPVIVVEDGASTSVVKTPRAGAAPDASKKVEAKGDEARAGEETPRESQGQGAEIRNAAPARPYTMPPSNASAQPSAEPTPKRKVIQWP